MKVVNVKLKSGIDIVGAVYGSEDPTTDDVVCVKDPIIMQFDYGSGVVYCKKYNMFSASNEVYFQKSDCSFVHVANERAIDYYESFLEKVAEAIDDEEMGDYEMSDDSEDATMEDLLEARMHKVNGKLN